MRALIAQNIAREEPGLIADVLRERKIAHDMIVLDGRSLPWREYDVLFVLGGPDSANDTSEKMAQELADVRAAVEHGMPFFGVCLGMQVLVKAMGGDVVRAPGKEVGWYTAGGVPYTISHEADDPILQGLSSPFRVFQLHGETVRLPDAATCIGRGNGACPIQLVKAGSRAYGIQSHIELTPRMLEIWLNEDPDLVPLNAMGMMREYKEVRKLYDEIGKKLIGNFLDIAGDSRL